MTTDMMNAAEVAELARGARQGLDADLADKSDAVMVANITELQAVVSGVIDLEVFLRAAGPDGVKSILCTALTTITETYAKRLAAEPCPHNWLGGYCDLCGAVKKTT